MSEGESVTRAEREKSSKPFPDVLNTLWSPLFRHELLSGLQISGDKTIK